MSPDFGGLGYSNGIPLDDQQEDEVLFLVSAWLEALNSADRSKSLPTPLTSRPAGRRGMTLSEKIFAAHDIEQNGFVTPGDVARVSVDWIMASELSWGVSVPSFVVQFRLANKGREWNGHMMLLGNQESSEMTAFGLLGIMLWTHVSTTILKSKLS